MVNEYNAVLWMQTSTSDISSKEEWLLASYLRYLDGWRRSITLRFCDLEVRACPFSTYEEVNVLFALGNQTEMYLVQFIERWVWG